MKINDIIVVFVGTLFLVLAAFFISNAGVNLMRWELMPYAWMAICRHGKHQHFSVDLSALTMKQVDENGKEREVFAWVPPWRAQP